MPNNFVLLRHFEDEQNVSTPDRDNSILESEKIKVPAIVLNIFKEFGVKPNSINIITSGQKRSIETTELISKEIYHLYKNESKIIIDQRIKGIFHGEYNINNLTSVSEKETSKLGHKSFIKEVAEKGNIDYKFGDSKDSEGRTIYPELDYIYILPGDSQREFTKRLYLFILDFFRNIYKSGNKDLYIIVTHTPIVFRFFEIATAFALKDQNILTITEGQLPYLEWGMVPYFHTDTSKLFISPGEFKLINVDSIIANLSLIEKEVELL